MSLNEEKKPKITLVGAGLTGPVLAYQLASRGHQIDMYESRPQPIKDRNNNSSFTHQGGRSINLALSHRGLTALRSLGIDKEIDQFLDQSVKMKGRFIHPHPELGQPFYQPYSIYNNYLYSCSRGDLNQLLLGLALKKFPDKINLHYNHSAQQLDIENKKLTFQNKNNQEQFEHHYEYLLACDGSSSLIREDFYQSQSIQKLTNGQHLKVDTGYGYKELTLFPENSQDLSNECLHIWPRKSFMLIALPNKDKSFTCTLFLPYEGNQEIPTGLNQLTDKKTIDNFFQKYFPDVFNKMPHVSAEFLSHPTGHLATLYCSPWNYKNEVLFIGDSIHGIVPFYGQGMNCCFEDCRLLMEMLDSCQENFKDKNLFNDFFQIRKPNTDAIASMALENFVEMRDKSSDFQFQLFKKLENQLMTLFPNEFFSQYYLVSFTDTPYEQAFNRGKKNKLVLESFLQKNPQLQSAEKILALSKNDCFEIFEQLKNQN